MNMIAVSTFTSARTHRAGGAAQRGARGVGEARGGLRLDEAAAPVTATGCTPPSHS